MKKMAILNDLTKCVGCEACVMACKETNELPRTGSTSKLSAENWTAVEHQKGLNIRRHCMHCEQPACASACPVGALVKTDAGAVTYDADKCMGCRYCMVACPFNVPTYEWHNPIPKVQKCIMCFEKRLQKGEQPACTASCPTGATVFGERDAMIKEARARLAAHPDLYVPHIYGLEEAGGTSVLYLSSVAFDDLGFPTNRRKEPYPELTWNVLSKIPNVVSTGGVLMFGMWWIINRRIKLQDQNNPDKLIEE